MGDTRSDLVLDERDGDVVTLTLNDPERRNAMTEAMGRDFARRVAALEHDERLRAVIVTGTGRAFSGGGDLDMLRELSERGHAEPRTARPETRDFMRAFYGMFLSVRRLPVPTIAAIGGHAIGAGLCFALGCDIRLVAREAKIGLNFVRVGLHPGMAATWTLPRLIGPGPAAELLYTGRIVDGETAASMGLASRALPAAEVLPAARELAAEIAAGGPIAVRGTKRSLRVSETASIDEQLMREAGEQALGYESDEILEGIAAAREGRPPRF